MEKNEIINTKREALFSINTHKILVKQIIVKKIINKSLEIKIKGHPIHP